MKVFQGNVVNLRMPIVLTVTALILGLMASCTVESTGSLLAASKASLERRDTKTATIQIKNVLQKSPSNPEARFLMGKALMLAGDPISALIELNKAEELGYAADYLAPEHARVLLQAGQAAKVVEKFNGVQLSDPAANAKLLAWIASAYWMVGKKDEAWVTINSALRADATERAAGLVHVRMQASVPPLSTAQTELELLLERFPDYADAWMLKAELLTRASGQKQEILNAYQQALKLDNAAVGAHAGIVTLRLQEQDWPGAEQQLDALRSVVPGSNQVGYLSALLAMHKGDLIRAREQIQGVLKRAPNNVPLLHLAGAIEFQRGALLQADAYLNKALAQVPDSPDIRLLLARVHLRAGEPGKALALTQMLLNAPDADPELFPLVAEAYLQTEEPQRAEQMFAKAVLLNPQDVASRVALVMSKMQAKPSIDETAELRTISTGDRGISADLALFSVLLRKKDYEQASKALDVLEKKIPSKPLADNLRGNLELSRGDTARARVAFKSALMKDQVFLPAAISLSKLDVEAKDFRKASQYFEDILKVDPRNLQARIFLINLKAQQGEPRKKLGAELLQLVKDHPTAVAPRISLTQLHLADGEFKLAVAAAQDGAAQLPDNAEIALSQGMAYAASGDNNQAMVAFNRAILLNPSSPQPHLAMAELYSRAKDYRTAIHSLKRALAIKPGYLPALSAMFGVEMATGQADKAVAVAHVLQEKESTAALGHVFEGDAELKRHRFDAAAIAYRKALQKAPDTRFAIKLHRTLVSLKDGSEGGKFAKRWLAEFPKDAIFIHHLGDIALQRSELDEAARRYNESLKLMPTNASAANNLSWIAQQQDKLEMSLKFAEEANALQSNNPQYMDTLAAAYANNGKLEKALEVQKLAVQMSPETHIHRFNLATLYIKAGKFDLAKVELQRLFDLGERFGMQAKVSDLLAKLR